MIPIITIQGPTCVGKTELTLKLAEKLNSEIISADSRQIYKYMDIGTAKPSKKILKDYPHHLIDIVEPDKRFSAGDFQREASKIIKKIHEKGKIPIISGGTGFYIKTLIQGLSKIPDIPEDIRKKWSDRISKNGNLKMYKKLEEIDPKFAKKIHPNDTQRLTRGLEVWDFSDKTLTEFWQEQNNSKLYNDFSILITDDRHELYERINKRVDIMLEDGLLKEIERLLEMNYSIVDPGMKTVGYQEFMPYFLEGKSLADSICKAKQNTRNYAKRQLTWNRKLDFNLTLKRGDINLLEILSTLKKKSPKK